MIGFTSYNMLIIHSYANVCHSVLLAIEPWEVFCYIVKRCDWLGPHVFFVELPNVMSELRWVCFPYCQTQISSNIQYHISISICVHMYICIYIYIHCWFVTRQVVSHDLPITLLAPSLLKSQDVRSTTTSPASCRWTFRRTTGLDTTDPGSRR